MSEVATTNTLTTPEFKQKLGSLFSYLVTHLGIKQSPKVKLINSQVNADNPFGFTGHYDHANQLITLYITGRHDTDILRSFAHEVIHHWQYERGTLHPEEHDKTPSPVSGKGEHTHYAQESPWLRRREMEAYLFGNILFRDWQDEQRMGPPATPPQLPQPLDENLNVSNEWALKNAVGSFVNDLIANQVLTTYHRKLSSGDMQTKDFANDLTHKLLEAIQTWIQTINNRSNWENQEGGMIKETVCKGCGWGCDYGNINEVSMGLIRCPNCKQKMDQEGNVYGR